MSVIDELEIIIRQKDGKVVASIPQLNLYAKAANVDAALASLDAKKAALVAEMEELGELGELEALKASPSTTSRPDVVNVRNDLGQFALKAGIVAVAITAIFIVSGLFIISSAHSALNSFKDMSCGGAEFWSEPSESSTGWPAPRAICPRLKRRSC